MVVENRQEFLAARNKQMLEFLENEKERFSQELEKKRIQWQQKIDSAFYATQDDWKANLSPEELKFFKLFERPPKVRYPLIHGEMIHAFLDVGGLIPVFGEVFDCINGFLYASQGRKTEAVLSFTATIPFWGTFGTIGKRIKSFFRSAGTGAEIGESIVKNADILSRESVSDKLSRYLLNKDHPGAGSSKAKWFEQALGFNQSNLDQLANQIHFNRVTAVATTMTEHGQKYNQIITITGANGKKIEVLFGWIENKDGVVRLVTAIPTK